MINYAIFVAFLVVGTFFFQRYRKRHNNNRPQISFLVPFKAKRSQSYRQKLWDWLQKYWRWELPDAEIVIGKSKGDVFSKAEAVNDAASRAKGRIFVILDADCYIDGSVIRHCANRIDYALRRGHKLWYVPYRNLFRLTKESTELVLASDPRHPYRFHSPPALDEVESTEGSGHGHRFGALIQIMPREAFFAVGGMDPRFRGWGGEDVAFVKALDTLYSPHKTTDNDVLHLWHPKIGHSYKTRMWEGQKTQELNSRLAHRYTSAAFDRARMRKLVNEGFKKEPPRAVVWTKQKVEALKPSKPSEDTNSCVVPSAPPPPNSSVPSVRVGAEGAIDVAVSKVGSPYVWGSAGPNSFDCSGLMVWAFGQVGISLPHYSGAQYTSTTRISRDQLKPGDLVFWGSGGSEHVALYMGGNQIVHAFSSNKATGVTKLDGWWKAPSGYGRI